MTALARNARCYCGSGKKYKMCHGRSESARTGKPHKDEIAFIICTPTRGTMVLQTHLALTFNVKGASQIQLTEERLPVIEARNKLAARAALAPETFRFIPREFVVVWVDDDAWWSEDTFPVLSAMFRAETAFDAICGYFGTRIPNTTPAAWRSDGSSPRPGVDCVRGTIVPIVRAGFHFFAHRLGVLARIGPDPFGDESNEISEDIYFCDRMTAAGMQIGCATGMPIAHIDASTGLAFTPGSDAMRASGNGLHMIEARFSIPDGSTATAETRSYGKSSDKAYRQAASAALEGSKQIAGVA